MNIIKKDLDKIAARPTQYITSLGEKGVFHLCKEAIDNNRDECYKKDSPGNKIDIIITDKQLSTRDNGRGIPTGIIQEVYETIQAGSNMTRSAGGTAGENGVGTTCILATSSFMEVTTIRPNEGKKLTLRYENHVLVDRIEEEYHGDDHGLILSFRPSKKILGTDRIPVEMLAEWISDFRYTLPTSIEMNYRINNKQYKVVHKPLAEYFDEFIDKDERYSNPLHVECNGKLKEVFMDEEYDRTFYVEAVFMYSSDSYTGDLIWHSWMNMIYTPQNGKHMSGVKKGFEEFIIEKIVAKNKKYAEENFSKDINAHLNIVVRSECDNAHLFSSQGKHTVIGDDLEKEIIKQIKLSLSKQSNAVIDEIIEVILANHRARVAGEQARSINKAVKDDKKWVQPKNFIPYSSIKTEEEKELYLVEGDSAGGGIRAARDARFQAIYMERGKSLLTWDMPIERALKSDIWRDLIKIMGAGVGPTFNMKKLKFGKFIIATDADIDGFQIRVINICFFVTFFPEIIKAGMLYIAEPPLYRLTIPGKKGYVYAATQNEYVDICINLISDVEISFPYKKKKSFPASEFVQEAFEYLTILREVSIERHVNSQFLEYIAWGIAKYDGVNGLIDNIDTWIRSLVNIYPELGFDHNSHQITSVIDYHDQLVVVDEYLENSLSYLIDVIKKYDIMIRYKSDRLKLDKTNTLSTFFIDIEKFYPQINRRYKGLGQSPADVSKEVIMDPATRRIIRLTMDDTKVMKDLAMLLSKDKDNLQARKEMLMNFNFTKNDIDN